jgi:glycosyltransferase involved in cell wall biosynthesis
MPLPANRPLDVAVVIPCYGHAQFIGDAIVSAQAQTLRPAEIVVVDDGSPDDVAGAVAAYPGVRLVKQPNRGLAAARNTGLRSARSPLVAFLDADDVLYPDALALGEAALAAEPSCAFAAGGYRWSDRGAGLVRDVVPARDAISYGGMLRSNAIGMHGAVLYRRDALAAVDGFREGLPACEDWDVYLRLLRLAPAAVHGGVVAEYRRHGANMSGDPVRMFAGALGALRRQRAHARRDPALRVAYDAGVRWARELYGDAVFDRARRPVGRAAWRDVLAAVRVLGRHDANHYAGRLARGAVAWARGARQPA